MNASANRWGPEEVRLWGGSALGALLLHLIPAGLLVLYLHWQPLPQPPTGTRSVLEVELAAMPSAASPPASSPHATSPPHAASTSAKPTQLAAVDPVRPLGKMPAVSQPAAVSSKAAPTADIGAASASLGTADLGSAATGMTLQLWLEEVRARLKSHMEYPDSAIQTMQSEGVMQDTVTLKFSVDPDGQVTYSRVNSAHHYQDLEQETRQMLRLSSALPAPPHVLAPDAVVTVPVQFDLEIRPAPCTGAHCSTAQAVQSKPHAVPPPPPTLESCTATASPGPAPSGSAATLEQMRAYRDTLNQYLIAGGSQLTCLSQVQDPSAHALQDTLTRQLHTLVDGFNAQTRVFQAKLQAQALQAQQAALRESQERVRAIAAQVYGTCTAPPALRDPGPLSAQDGASFRHKLIDYQSAVHRYVDCLQQAERAATDPSRGLSNDQRAQLDLSAAQRGNAAIAAFNQLVGLFNAQVPHIRKAIAAQNQLAEAVVRGTAIFPSSTWNNLPLPLPPDECISINQVGQSYRAQLCNPTYTVTVSGLSQQLSNSVERENPTAEQEAKKAYVKLLAQTSGLPAWATKQEAIAAQHGLPADLACHGPSRCAPPVLGLTITTQAGPGLEPSARVQTVTYSISELQVAGRRISMTITGRSSQDTTRDESNAVHFDLVLSPDNRILRGNCWTGQQRSICSLARHMDASGADNSHH